MKIRKGDTVKIISGNYKGKTGKVLVVFPKKERAAVEGVNLKKKHVRPRRQGQKGEVVLIPASLPLARMMLLCLKCGGATRIGYRIGEQGRKTRVCKKCGGET
jgi:large subunit ribosomal protein L24